MDNLSKGQEVWYRRLGQEQHQKGIIAETWEEQRTARLESGEFVRMDGLLPVHVPDNVAA